jgi:translation initiation factor IF-2
LNVILKGDVDGSVEALSDSFSKLSTEESKSYIHKGVGAITETDVSFCLRCNLSGLMCVRQVMLDSLLIKKKLYRYYSIIYAAIDDLKDAMEGMLALEMKEEVWVLLRDI